jgi:hypothetical protein
MKKVLLSLGGLLAGAFCQLDPRLTADGSISRTQMDNNPTLCAPIGAEGWALIPGGRNHRLISI